MTTDTLTAVVNVSIRREDGVIFADSKDVPGLHVCAKSEDVLMQRIMQAMKTLFKLNKGMDVTVQPITSLEDFPNLHGLPKAFALATAA